ncbi:hypothetical protein FDN13_07125 [Caloramator sp. E03]|uniref:hypothetical protein n=1 Tax=Caloramator sp. E03 TaxID=2576307 RepID=UPI00110FFA3F|nr:hypothetical protein [Caloramator sp. E03]QCX33500.1 hypothetical protein FDN13_07125 [Caloramator sp. E03]
MLDVNVFKEFVNKLDIEYKEKGFLMTTQRAKQWYEYMKDMTDEEFKQRIDWVLKNVSFSPSMADVFKAEINTNNTWIKEADLSDLM